DEDGNPTNIDLTAAVEAVETVTTLVDNGDGTLSYTDEDGNPTNIDLTAAVEAVETVTTLVDNGDGTFAYANENNVSTNFNTTAKPIIVTTDESFDIDVSHYTIILNDTNPPSTDLNVDIVNLPAANDTSIDFGKIFIIKNNRQIDVNINIENSVTQPDFILNGGTNEALWIQTDGNNWYQIN
ncbi:hypothetical protein VM932_07800, partial [Muricauda sp. SYSU M86414]|nr:hypothetical protein [Muricauda sp. SYSU M86414]